MICPKCGGSRCESKGVRGLHRRYKCHGCGNYWTDGAPPKEAADPLVASILKRYSRDELEAIARGRGSDDLKTAAPMSMGGGIVKVLVITDTHWGSAHVNDAWYLTALAEGKREGVSELWHAGDVTEGMSGRDGHVYELRAIGYTAQRDMAVEFLRRAEMPIKAIAGNHDLWFSSKADMGADIVQDICSRIDGAEYLGPHEADIPVNGVKVRLFHGEDGASYALSYRVQKIIESFQGGEKPEVLITGHDHKAGYFFIRNVHTILGGCLQKQTPWMRRKKIQAMPGFYILTMCIGDGEVKWIDPRFYPFYR